MMEAWTRGKRKREEVDIEVETTPGTSDEQVPTVGGVVSDDGTGASDVVGCIAPGTEATAAVDVDVEHVETVTNIDTVDTVSLGETLVTRVRKKFDTHSLSLNTDCNTDFASWKRRREELKRLRELPGHGPVEERGHGGTGEKELKKIRISSASETGANLKTNRNTNYNCYSFVGGQEAGVHREEGGQGGEGAVHPVQADSVRQYTRTVGTFLISAGRQECTAATTVGKTGSEGQQQYNNRA